MHLLRSFFAVVLLWACGSAPDAFSGTFHPQFPLLPQNPTQGVAVINSDRGRYLPGDPIHLAMAVLNSKGKMICTADVEVVIRNLETGRKIILTSQDGDIQVTEQCAKKDFGLMPDYWAKVSGLDVGTYEALLTARSVFGEHKAKNIFKVKRDIPFYLYRDTAARIYPKFKYPVNLHITANRDFRGTVVERVPREFDVFVQGPSVSVKEDNVWKVLTWQVDWKKGEKHQLHYEFMAPNRSPAYYEIARVSFFQDDMEVFKGFRRWQIAGDTISEHYVARRVAEETTTTAGWSAVTGTSDTGTVASTNGWIDGSNFTVGEDYLVLAWGFYNCDNANANCGMRVTHGGTSFAESETQLEPAFSSASYKHPYFWFTVWTAADEDLEIEMYRGGNTARVEDITLVAINAEDLIADGNLQYDIDTTGGTLSTTLATKVSVTWTPANDGDTWLVMAYSRGDINAVSGDTYEQRLVLDGTNMTTAIIDGEDINDFVNVPSAYARTFSNASTTIGLQIRRGNGAHAWTDAGIMALRLNVFESFIIDATPGTIDMNAGDDQYNQLASVTLAPRLTSDWIVTGGLIADDNGSEVTARIQLDNADITSEQGGQNWATSDQVPFIAADVFEYEARVSRTWDLDGRETGNSTNPDAEDAWLAAFSLSTYDRTRRVVIVDH